MKVTRNRLRTERVMAETNIAPEATDLLFEAEDVAEIIVEITGEDVDVEADGDVVSFTVGDETYECTADGDEEVLESSTQIRGKRRVSASTVRKSGRKISAGKQLDGKTVRRLPRR